MKENKIVTPYVLVRKGRYGLILPIPSGKLARELEESMKYIKQGAQFMPNPMWAVKKLYNIDLGKFPWGFLQRIINILTQNGEQYLVNNKKIIDKTKEIDNNQILRDYQKEAVKKIIENDGGVLCMPTGSGKTITIIEFLKLFNKKSLVIVPTLDIKKQWEDHNLDFLDVKTYQSIKKKHQLLGYEFVITDESHHTAAMTIYKIAMNCNDSILIGCSATPFRSDGEELRIEAALGAIIHSVPRKQLIEQGFLVDAKIKYIPLSKPEKEFLSYHEAYQKFIVENKERNGLIIEKALEESQNKQVLILVQKIEHGETILGLLEGKKACFIRGSLGKKERKKMFDEIRNNEYRITIATSLFDEGVDVPNFEVLILAVGGKSSVKVVQRVGRILRPAKGKNEATVYDFIDEFKWLKKHYLERRRILEKEDYVVEELKY